MKVRAAILVLALLPVGAATTAVAATKPKPKPLPKVCNLIQDDKGDAKYNGAVPGDGNDDILSGDISSNGKVITGVLRMSALAQPDPMSPLGQAYFVDFNAKGAENTLFLSARTYPTGTKYVFGYSAVDPTSKLNTSYTIGAATGSIDTAKKEVHITAPNAGFAPAGSKLVLGTKLLGPTATTWRIVGQSVVPSQNVAGQRAPLGGLLLPFDTASSSKSYVIGQASCVKAGS